MGHGLSSVVTFWQLLIKKEIRVLVMVRFLSKEIISCQSDCIYVQYKRYVRMSERKICVSNNAIIGGVVTRKTVVRG